MSEVFRVVAEVRRSHESEWHEVEWLFGDLPYAEQKAVWLRNNRAYRNVRIESAEVEWVPVDELALS